MPLLIFLSIWCHCSDLLSSQIPLLYSFSHLLIFPLRCHSNKQVLVASVDIWSQQQLNLYKLLLKRFWEKTILQWTVVPATAWYKRGTVRGISRDLEGLKWFFDPNSKIGFILSFKQTMQCLLTLHSPHKYILSVFPQDSEKVSFFRSTFHVTTAMQKNYLKREIFDYVEIKIFVFACREKLIRDLFVPWAIWRAGSSAISAPWMSTQHCTSTSTSTCTSIVYCQMSRQQCTSTRSIVYCRMIMQQFHQGGCDGTSIPRTLPYACSPAFATQIILGGGSWRGEQAVDVDIDVDVSVDVSIVHT